VTPIQHLCQAAKLCILSHVKDIVERSKVQNIKVSFDKNTKRLVVEIECDKNVKNIIQEEAIEKCFILNLLKELPTVKFRSSD